MEDSSSSLTNSSSFPTNRLKTKTEAVRPSASLRFQQQQQLSSEELKETLEKTKEYLRMVRKTKRFLTILIILINRTRILALFTCCPA